MIKPAFLEQGEDYTVMGHFFESPVVVKGLTGLPILEFFGWGILTRVAGSKHPEWSVSRRLSAGAITTVILFSSEWCHNLAHTVTAWKIGKPVDAIRIFFGTPLLIYYDINDQQVTASQHIARASGGPIFNALMILPASLIRSFTRPGTFSRYIADYLLGTNIILSTVSLLPIPGIDGGPLLKWLLVNKGRSIAEADEAVKKVNLAVGSSLVLASGVALKKRRKWLAAASIAFAITSLAVGLGLLKEQK
jgi:Zn-dependent protease